MPRQNSRWAVKDGVDSSLQSHRGAATELTQTLEAQDCQRQALLFGLACLKREIHAILESDDHGIDRVPLWIDGKPVQSAATEWLDVINPATQEVVSRVPCATQEEMQVIRQAETRTHWCLCAE